MVDKRTLPESMVYLISWIIVLLFPLVSTLLAFASGECESIRWEAIFRTWQETLPFFLLFLLNHFLLLPYLFLRKRILIYILTAFFCSFLILYAATFLPSSQPPSLQQRRAEGAPKIHLDGERDKITPLHERRDAFQPGRPFGLQPPPQINSHPFLPIAKGPFIGRMLVAILMLSFNIAVRLFFKSLQDDEAMKELARQNLQSELEYLKYQINPHFFMNTLNNIHALVDIDAEKAKQTILELSRLMRYMLYEANNRTVSLKKEIDFLKHYVDLMRLRYTEKVEITFQITFELGNVQVPPLLLISFVENAFKHGVSYQHPSYIHITLGIVDEELVFRCINSNFGKQGDQHHGIGLENISKRLRLIFGNRYTFSIRDEADYFEVVLAIPVTHF